MAALIDGLQDLHLKPGDAIPATPTKASVLVDPDLAQDWLTRYSDPKKRTIRNLRVDSYARDMTAGRWVGNKDSLEFMEGTTPLLTDGHHRLHAVIKSGCTIRFEVWFAAPAQVRMVEGNRITRTAADTLRMNGCIQYAPDIAASSRLVLCVRQTVGSTDPWRPARIDMPDNDDITLCWMEDPDRWYEACAVVGRIVKSIPEGIPPRVIRAFGYLAENAYPGEGFTFIDIVGKGGGPLSNGRTLTVVLTNLMRSHGYGPSISGSQLEWDRIVYEFFMRAFNAYIKDKTTFDRPRLGSLPLLLEDFA